DESDLSAEMVETTPVDITSLLDDEHTATLHDSDAAAEAEARLMMTDEAPTLHDPLTGVVLPASPVAGTPAPAPEPAEMAAAPAATPSAAADDEVDIDHIHDDDQDEVGDSKVDLGSSSDVGSVFDTGSLEGSTAPILPGHEILVEGGELAAAADDA